MIYLSYREISIIIWFLVLVLYIFTSNRLIKVRESINRVKETFFSKHIILSLLKFIIYSITILFLLSKLKLYSFNLLKDSIIWILTTWSYILWNYKKIHKKEEVKNFIIGNFKLVAIIQLFVGLYTFNFIIELIIIPILIIVSSLFAFSELYIEYKDVTPVLEKILAFISVIMLLNSGVMIYVDRDNFFTLSNIYSLFFTSFLNFLSLPFILYTVLYLSYEQVYTSLPRIVRRKFDRFFLSLYIMIKFNFRFELLTHWCSSIFLLNGKTVKEIKGHINNAILEDKKDREANKIINKDKFCPYKAKIFLSSEGIYNSKYKYVNTSWVSNSNFLEFGNGILKSNISYTIYKNENSLEKLVLILDLMDISDKDLAHKKLTRCVSIIYKNLFNKDIDFKLRRVFSNDCMIDTKCNNISLTSRKNIWPNHQYNGYDVVVKIEFL